MKNAFLSLVLLLVAIPAVSQQANINAPAAQPAATKIVIVDFVVRRDCACAWVATEQQDAGSNAVRQVRYDVPDPAFPTSTLQGLVGAMIVARASETGVNTRKMSFRILGYLSDQGYLTGVTLVP